MERLEEIARTFNESLKTIDEKKKQSMTNKTSMQTLPPISETGPASGTTKRHPFFGSRPVSAVTTRSVDSKEGLYKFACHFFIVELFNLERI